MHFSIERSNKFKLEKLKDNFSATNAVMQRTNMASVYHSTTEVAFVSGNKVTVFVIG